MKGFAYKILPQFALEKFGDCDMNITVILAKMNRENSKFISFFLLFVFYFCLDALYAEKPDFNERELETQLQILRETRTEHYRLLDDWKKEKAELEKQLLLLEREQKLIEQKQKKQSQLNQKLETENQKLRNEKVSNQGEDQKLLPELMTWVKNYSESLEKDIPYQKRERSKRFSSLLSEMKENVISENDAFQKVWNLIRNELALVENIETSEGIIKNKDGEEKLVELLRIGGIALFYRSGDKAENECGYLKQTNNQYAWLKANDEKLKREIQKFFAIVEKSQTPEFQNLPVIPQTFSKGK